MQKKLRCYRVLYNVSARYSACILQSSGLSCNTLRWHFAEGTLLANFHQAVCQTLKNDTKTNYLFSFFLSLTFYMIPDMSTYSKSQVLGYLGILLTMELLYYCIREAIL